LPIFPNPTNPIFSFAAMRIPSFPGFAENYFWGKSSPISPATDYTPPSFFP